MLNVVMMQSSENQKVVEMLALYRQIANMSNGDKSGNKKLETGNGVVMADLARGAAANVFDYQRLLATCQQQQQQQFDEQTLLNLQRQNILRHQFEEHLKKELQKQQNEQQQANEQRSFEKHMQRSNLSQAVYNKDKTNKSANASSAVKQHLQKFVIERQKGKQLDTMIDRNRPYGWPPALNSNGLHEISAPYPHFFDKRSTFPLRKTASEPNLKVPSKMKQKVTLDRRNSPLVPKNSADVRTELANKLKRKLNNAEQDATNSAPNSGSSSPLNNSHNEGSRVSVGSNEDNRLGASGMPIGMYADTDLQRLAVTRTASLPAPFMQASLPFFPGFTESLAVKMLQRQQLLAAAELQNAEQSPGPIRHTPVSRPHKGLSRTHSAPTSSAQLQMQQFHRKQQKLLQQQNKHLPHMPPGMVAGDYYQRLPTHKEAPPAVENAKPSRSRVHLAASPPPTHPSVSHTTVAALASHLRHSKMHGSFPHLPQKSKNSDSMDHEPVESESARSVIVSAPSSDSNHRVSTEDISDSEKDLSTGESEIMKDFSPLAAHKKLAAMALNDSKHPRRSLMSGDMMLHRPLTRTQSSPAVSFSQKPSLKKYKFTTCLGYDPVMLKHGCACGDPHAEHAGRVKEIWARLNDQGLVDDCESIEPRKATMEELQLAHTYEHTLRYGASPLARQQTVMSDKFIVLPCGGLGVNNRIDIDTVWNEQDTINAARMAVGITVDLALMVAEGHLKNGFAVVRPPGHHAEKDLAMAFCYFNAVAVAARKLQSSLPTKMRRILIVDWDAHHCNGTQNIFYDDPSVLVISIHRYDEGNFFPGTGAPEETGDGPGVGFNVNIGFSGGVDPPIGDAEYLSAFRSIVLPIAEEFKPDFVFVSAGFSASAGHPATLGGYHVTPQCFSYLTRMLSKLADGKMVMALEGGFELGPLCDCVEACVRTLMKDATHDEAFNILPPASVEDTPCETSNRSLNKIGRIQERYWSGIKRSASFLRTSHAAWMRDLQDDRTCNAMASLSVEHGTNIKPKEVKSSRILPSAYATTSIQESTKVDEDSESKLVIVTDEPRDDDAMSSASSPLDVVGVSSPSPAPSPVPSPIHSIPAAAKSPVIVNNSSLSSSQVDEDMEADTVKENS